MNPVALVVDDDPVSRVVLSHMLRRRGWEVDEADDVPAAQRSLSDNAYDVVLSDFHLPSGDGIDVLEAAELADCVPAFVLVTGVIEHCSLREDAAARVTAQLTKPVSSQALDSALRLLGPDEES